jgi:hypothetical protein
MEHEQQFLDRIGARIAAYKEGDAVSCSFHELKKLYESCIRWRRLETEAAKYCETVIVMRSKRFTAEFPYTGWKGLGIALSQDYDELDRLRQVNRRE